MTWQSDTERAIRGAVLAVAAVLFAATCRGNVMVS